MNEYLSGKCAHCGGKSGEHRTNNYYGETGLFCNFRGRKQFVDSGEKLLHDRAPELLTAARSFLKMLDEVNPKIPCTYLLYYSEKLKALESLIAEITK